MLLLRTLAVACALAPAACNAYTDPYGGLQVSIAVSTRTVRPGEPVAVTVTARNSGVRSIAINSTLCPEAFIVTTVAGEIVAPGERICTLELRSEVLAPGEAFVFQHSWTGDARRGRTEGPSEWLPPGEYWLRGRVLARDVGLVLSDTVTVRVES